MHNLQKVWHCSETDEIIARNRWERAAFVTSRHTNFCQSPALSNTEIAGTHTKTQTTVNNPPYANTALFALYA